MSKHSPGPWKTCGARDGKCKCGLIWSIGGDYSLATVRCGEDTEGQYAIPEDEYLANAALIASAPDIAARLVRAEELLREYVEDETPTGSLWIDHWAGRVRRFLGGQPEDGKPGTP